MGLSETVRIMKCNPFPSVETDAEIYNAFLRSYAARYRVFGESARSRHLSICD